ncbi:TPA: hypothetical protein SLP14_002018 [Serratia marcescens]|nr:hypothetical protein [Serratia marcescens]
MKGKIILFGMMFFSISTANAETFDEFFQKNPNLSSNIAVRMAIKQKASLMAYSEATSEGAPDAVKRSEELVRKDGGMYAQYATDLLSKDCGQGEPGLQELQEKDCEYLRANMPNK